MPRSRWESSPWLLVAYAAAQGRRLAELVVPVWAIVACKRPRWLWARRRAGGAHHENNGPPDHQVAADQRVSRPRPPRQLGDPARNLVESSRLAPPTSSHRASWAVGASKRVSAVQQGRGPEHARRVGADDPDLGGRCPPCSPTSSCTGPWSSQRGADRVETVPPGFTPGEDRPQSNQEAPATGGEPPLPSIVPSAPHAIGYAVPTAAPKTVPPIAPPTAPAIAAKT